MNDLYAFLDVEDGEINIEYRQDSSPGRDVNFYNFLSVDQIDSLLKDYVLETFLKIGQLRGTGSSNKDVNYLEIEQKFCTIIDEILFPNEEYSSFIHRFLLDRIGLLRIFIETHNDFLLRIPWETFVLAPNNQKYANELFGKVAIVRTPNVKDHLWVPQDNIKIMVVGSDQTPNFSLEVNEIRNAFSRANSSERLTLIPLPFTNPIELAKELENSNGVDILHIVTHGEEGGVTFQDLQGHEWLVNATELAAYISKAPPKHLLVSMACNSSHPFEGNSTSGMGYGMTSKLQIPAVISMQFIITPEAAQKFTSHFYYGVAMSRTITESFAGARKSLHNFRSQSPEKFSPTLYLSGRHDGQILTIGAQEFFRKALSKLRSLEEVILDDPDDHEPETLLNLLKVISELQKQLRRPNFYIDKDDEKSLATFNKMKRLCGAVRKPAHQMLDILKLKDSEQKIKYRIENYWDYYESFTEKFEILLQTLEDYIR